MKKKQTPTNQDFFFLNSTCWRIAEDSNITAAFIFGAPSFIPGMHGFCRSPFVVGLFCFFKLNLFVCRTQSAPTTPTLRMTSSCPWTSEEAPRSGEPGQRAGSSAAQMFEQQENLRWEHCQSKRAGVTHAGGRGRDGPRRKHCTQSDFNWRAKMIVFNIVLWSKWAGWWVENHKCGSLLIFYRFTYFCDCLVQVGVCEAGVGGGEEGMGEGVHICVCVEKDPARCRVCPK